jgi:peptide-methionine (R)-S-oxide reductase
MRSPAGYDVSRLTSAEIDRLAQDLSREERHVILSAGTERPFCGTLLDNKKDGTYVCRLCGLPLFRSTAKFESGTGWPSFFEPYAREHVEQRPDVSHGMVRTEINCQRCGGHLGHVFDDGPRPTGQRYCLNSASLEFVEAGQALPRKVSSDADAPAT